MIRDRFPAGPDPPAMQRGHQKPREAAEGVLRAHHSDPPAAVDFVEQLLREEPAELTARYLAIG